MDGTLCFGWDCCINYGGRKRCPPDFPIMCAQVSVKHVHIFYFSIFEDNDCYEDHCCEIDCSDKGGPRTCSSKVFENLEIQGILSSPQSWNHIGHFCLAFPWLGLCYR
eukprot:UN27816